MHYFENAFTGGVLGIIKKYIIGVDKGKIIVHNKNVINSVDKTLITNK